MPYKSLDSFKTAFYDILITTWERIAQGVYEAYPQADPEYIDRLSDMELWRKTKDTAWMGNIFDDAGDGVFSEGHITPQNFSEAILWYLKAAKQGYASTQFSLGYMYANGEGVAEDNAEAVRWYHKGAEQGNEWAQIFLGYMYEFGEGVAENHTEAERWYRNAAEQRNTLAQLRHELLYVNAEGVAEYDDKAVRWYHKVAQNGNTWAQTLGIIYYNTSTLYILCNIRHLSESA